MPDQPKSNQYDLAWRLRHIADDTEIAGFHGACSLAFKAADELDRLRAENAKLTRAYNRLVKAVIECQEAFPAKCAACDAIFAKTAKEGEREQTRNIL